MINGIPIRSTKKVDHEDAKEKNNTDTEETADTIDHQEHETSLDNHHDKQASFETKTRNDTEVTAAEKPNFLEPETACAAEENHPT